MHYKEMFNYYFIECFIVGSFKIIQLAFIKFLSFKDCF